MRAAICVQGPRVATYTDVMAKIMKEHPQTKAFDVLIFGDVSKEDIEGEMERDLASLVDYEFYQAAGKPHREFKKVSEFEVNRQLLNDYGVVDVSGVSKELMAEILSITMINGQSTCALSWKDRTKDRKYVGENECEYFDVLKSPAVQKMYHSQRVVWIMFCFMALLIAIFVTVSIVSFFGLNLISDELINFCSLLLGVGGVGLSYIALRNSPKLRN